MRKLLMHACCGPCFAYVQKDLEENGILNENGEYEKVDYTAFFYNPNIHPLTEFKKRKEAFEELCNIKKCKYIISDDYDISGFVKDVELRVKQNKEFSRRCEYCYYRRLKKVFEYAKENGFDMVSTTLTISPYQDHISISKTLKRLEKEYGISGIYVDYRPHYLEGQEIAKSTGIYMQKYCGCIFSLDEKEMKINFKNTNMTNFYTLPKKKRVEIKRIENKKEYMEFFLEADPSENMVLSYLEDSDVYGLMLDGNILSIAVIYHIDYKTLELKNLVTKEEYRNKGYAKMLLKSLCGNYKQKYDKMLVGTTENNIPFYVKQGFGKYEKTIKNFFIDNYKEEIKDGNLTCTDLIYYSKNLKINNSKK